MADEATLLAPAALRDSGAVSPQDAVLVALHSNLLSAGFLCVATGDEGFGGNTTDMPAVSTRVNPQLPPGWNGSHDVCSLQYKHEATGQMCLVKAIPMGEQLLISAVVAHRDTVFTLTISPSKYVADRATYNCVTVFTNLSELMSTLKREIQMKLSAECAGVVAVGVTAPQSQSAPSLATGSTVPDNHFPAAINPFQPGPSNMPDPTRIHDPLRIGPPRRPVGDPDPLGMFSPSGYGDRDRLPFGGGGGGMIFDPRHNPGAGGFPGVGPLGPHPPGHPPGARFDPVSPLRPTIRPPPPHPGHNPPGAGYYGPNPDHLPPPGYDDMFS